jgi:bifunctional DNA-binding transcriptional regulator/antitoxin component of YhaV-PrlF toxin-antitoxin module
MPEQKVSYRSRVVKAQGKGQITIPREFREALAIYDTSLLNVSLVGDHLEITPVRSDSERLRQYTEEDIARFLEEDKIDEHTAKRVRELLDQGLL